MISTPTTNALHEQESKEESLTIVFNDCYDIYLTKFSDCNPQKVLTQEIISETYEKLVLCTEWIDQLGCFSSNEFVDDVSTKDLKFLLVPYLLAEFIQLLEGKERRHVLTKAQAYLRVFCTQAERLGLTTKDDIFSFDKELLFDAAGKRALKVARFKKQREISNSLSQLRKRFTDETARGKKSILGNWEEDMEDEEREAWILEIKSGVNKALDTLDSLQREEEMLSAAQELESNFPDKSVLEEQFKKRQTAAEQWHQSARRKAQEGTLRPSAPISCATFAQDVIEGRSRVGEKHVHHKPKLGFGPVSLIGSGGTSTFREAMAAQVFQPSHSLPGMSIEEAGLREMKIMEALQGRMAKAAEESGMAAQPKENIEEGEGDEASEYKARAWDDWKDENPRGMGNSKLTPCG